MSVEANSFSQFPKEIEDPTELLQDIFTASAEQKYGLGSKFTTFIGGSKRVFRYVKAGSVALARGGLMCQAPAAIANHNEHVGGAGTTGALNELEIQIGLLMTTALLANQYKDGTLVVNKATGLGEVYPIKKHTNTVTPLITLHEKIRVAVDTTSEFTLISNPFRDVIVVPTTASGIPVGIPLVAIPAGQYGWVQSGGPASIIMDTAEPSVIGQPIGYPASPAVAGAGGVPAVTDTVWGTALTTAIAAEAAGIWLTLDK